MFERYHPPEIETKNKVAICNNRFSQTVFYPAPTTFELHYHVTKKPPITAQIGSNDTAATKQHLSVIG